MFYLHDETKVSFSFLKKCIEKYLETSVAQAYPSILDTSNNIVVIMFFVSIGYNEYANESI